MIKITTKRKYKMTHRKIIIEGIDGTGKSTLAKKIAKGFDIPLHISGARPKTLEEYRQRVKEELAIKDGVLDRCCAISNYCYQSVNDFKVDDKEALKDIVDILSTSESCKILTKVYGEVASEWDTEEYTQKIEKNTEVIKLRYSVVLDIMRKL
jgi:adenylate kinase family enzyme